ncbi:patatin-like phospholipase family protein [Halorhabdus amylolytica]|uniref:patatin-like phospholipase family protein n=1 Tax=Halorhabdus amylolytica TaxID=2559573 RepID=UPI0010A9B856|nr:patatin-like phospholipase family protein [Halorhabdus amylolytica]
MSENPPERDQKQVAIACQGGGSHTAFTAGVLDELLGADLDIDIVGFSGTSGGAICAALAWYGREHPEHNPGDLLLDFWAAMAAKQPTQYATNAWVQGILQLQRLGYPVPEVSPDQLPKTVREQDDLRRILERLVDFDTVPDLVEGDAPVLLISAIDVLSGDFRLFREDKLSPETILASTAEPSLFQAVEVGGNYYWDGLFAKNPPIQAFSTTEGVCDPDEVWVIKINPQHRDRVPKRLDGINDRRNELSGNLSLNTEAGFVEQVNEWIEKGYLPDRYTTTDIRRIRLTKNLDWHTKLDRDPQFIETLIEDGRKNARTFLSGLETR